jgi:hypothetical protein
VKGICRIFGGLLIISSPTIAAGDDLCRDSKQVIDACFTVHGRLQQSNGNPNMRIWIVGTHHILGVLDSDGRDESETAVPPNVKKLGGEYVSKPVFGDFEVCPLTKAHRGWMQMVCVESGARLRIGKFN